MKKLIIILFAVLVLPFALTHASDKNKKELDKEAIKKMTGVYNITYRFAETFASDTNYQFHPRHVSGAVELIFVIEETDNLISIQHLSLEEGMASKHWREDWVYENTSALTYAGDNEWKHFDRNANEVKGQWTQRIYQIDESPRYEGSASWVFADGKAVWQSECEAPLPRRELIEKREYKVLHRGNRYFFTDFGYVHEQDNLKRIPNGSDVIMVMEKGYVTYERMDDAAGAPALEYWEKNKSFWGEVRNVWNDIYAQKTDVKMHEKVENKSLFTELLKLNKKYNSADGSSSGSTDEIKELIYKYIIK